MGMRSSTRKPALPSLSRFSSGVAATCPLVALFVSERWMMGEGGGRGGSTGYDDFLHRVGRRRGILFQFRLGDCGLSFVGGYPFSTKSDANTKKQRRGCAE